MPKTKITPSQDLLPVERIQTAMQALGQRGGHPLHEVVDSLLVSPRIGAYRMMQMSNLPRELIGDVIMLKLDQFSPEYRPDGLTARDPDMFVGRPDFALADARSLYEWSAGGGLIDKMLSVAQHIFALFGRGQRRKVFREMQAAEPDPDDPAGEY